MKKFRYLLLSRLCLVMTTALLLGGCSGSDEASVDSSNQVESVQEEDATTSDQDNGQLDEDDKESESDEQDTVLENNDGDQPEASISTISLADIPAFDGTPYIAVNNNIPYFTDSDYTTDAFETYSELDSLGRCGVAYANICQEIMPTEKRGEIGSVKPTGWHTVKYDIVDGKYLYNRCHLIGYQLAGENANNKNLITGTRYMNVDGMLPFENLVADYVKETNNHVLYRVTPVFDGDNLVASGVLMEAYSVEDNGEGITFNIYCYNAQPGITIDYATGDSAENGEAVQSTQNTEKVETEQAVSAESEPVEESAAPVETTTPSAQTYILNTNTKKFHRPSCGSVSQMKESNKQEITASRDEIISMGYDPCKKCNP